MSEKKGVVTPIHMVNTELPINLYIKREDLLPFSFGGNKVRIADEFYEDMRNKGKNCMVGYGNARSNLCRALANSKLENEKCYIISPADDDGQVISTNNSQMVENFGAELRYCTKQNVSSTVDKVINEIKSKGFDPYYIYGNKFGNGNEEVPVRAYEKVYHEIKQQQKNMNINFDYIFLATGTGMTLAGLLVGKEEALGNENIIGISIARKSDKVIESVKKYITSYNESMNGIPIKIVDRYVSGGYGQYTYDIINTIYENLKLNGLPLDPTYTGKAFWGMHEYILENKIENKNVLFIHTGGVPLFFDFLNNERSVNFKVIKLSNSEANCIQLADYLTTQSREFAVPLLDKIEPFNFSKKILNSGYVFCIFDKGKIQGVIAGYANDTESKQAYESLFVVSKDYRGSHAAKDLFFAQKNYCINNGMESIIFTTNKKNKGAIKFYEKMNVPIEKEKCDDNLIAYKLYF